MLERELPRTKMSIRYSTIELSGLYLLWAAYYTRSHIMRPLDLTRGSERSAGMLLLRQLFIHF